MRERTGTRRSSQLGIFLLSAAPWLAPGCGGTAEQTDAQLTEAGNLAGIGAATAAPAESPMTGPSAGQVSDAPSMPSVAAMMAGHIADAPAQAASAGAGGSGAEGAPTAINAGAGAISAGAGADATDSMATAASTGAGSSASAGAGAMESPGASAMVPPGSNNFVSVCEGGTVGMDSDAAKATLRGLDIQREYSGVKMLIRSPNAVLSFKTTLQVPKPPTQRQTLFVWPGLQSRDGAADPNRVGNGVLQPVLTWGPSCAPQRPSDPYAGWWIAGMYVKYGCEGGDYLTTEVGDLLEIDMFLKDEKWETTIRNVRMDKTVDFTMDLRGQVQNEVMWLTEVPDGSSIRPVDDVIWTQNVLTFKEPEETCQPNRIGSNDYFSAPTLSPDGLHCCWDTIIMRAER